VRHLDQPGIRRGARQQTSDTLEDPYIEVLDAVDRSAVRGADETSWQRAGQTQWLSVATAEHAALFQIADRRDRDSARALLGESPTGTIVSDRYAVYLFIDDSQRQLCLAHVLRDFTAWASARVRPGAWAASCSASSARCSPRSTRPAATALT
jgi:transposase